MAKERIVQLTEYETEELKKQLDKEERVRQDHILLRKIYETVITMQHDMDMKRKDKQIDSMKKEVERLNKEITYLEEDKRYIQQHKYDMLDERY